MDDFIRGSQEHILLLIDLCFSRVHPEPPAAAVTLKKDLVTGDHQASGHSTASHCKTEEVERTDF